MKMLKPISNRYKNLEAESCKPEHLCRFTVFCCFWKRIFLAVTDGAVTMAVKSSLRNGIPILLAIATNDALSGSAQNIGKLLNTKNIYFVPAGQDDPMKKPNSVIADFEQLMPAMAAALKKEQIQPILR